MILIARGKAQKSFLIWRPALGTRLERVHGRLSALTGQVAPRDFECGQAAGFPSGRPSGVSRESKNELRAADIGWDDEVQLVAGVDHSARRGGARLSLLVAAGRFASERWVMPPRGSLSREDLHQLFVPHSLAPWTMTVETRFVVALKSLVARAGFITCMPARLVMPELAAGMIVLFVLAVPTPRRHFFVSSAAKACCHWRCCNFSTNCVGSFHCWLVGAVWTISLRNARQGSHDLLDAAFELLFVAERLGTAITMRLQYDIRIYQGGP